MMDDAPPSTMRATGALAVGADRRGGYVAGLTTKPPRIMEIIAPEPGGRHPILDRSGASRPRLRR